MMGCNGAAVASLKTLEHWQVFAHSLTCGLLVVHVESSSWPWFAVQHLFQLIILFLFQVPALTQLQLLLFLS